MKKGIIFVNGYTQSVTELNQPNRIREELDLLGVKTEIRRNLCFSAGLNSRSEIVTDCRHFDFCVYLDKDKYLPRMLEDAGLRLFNCARAVELCDDKMATFIALQGTGLRIPKTFAAPLNYTLQAPVNCDMLEKISEELRFPLVVKECYGSLGKGVYLVKNMTELQRIAEELKGKPHLFQEFISESAGKDLRVIAIGEKSFPACGGFQIRIFVQMPNSAAGAKYTRFPKKQSRLPAVSQIRLISIIAESICCSVRMV